MTASPGAHDRPFPRHESLTVIFKGSNRCNAGCSFCSVGEAGGRMISEEEFEIVARQLERLVRGWGLRRIQFTFHGGEPTLLGAKRIDSICSRLNKLPIPVSFNMQSNLLRWNDGLSEVLTRHAIVLGTSVDPIAGDRLDAQGRDAYPVWLDNYLKVSKVMRAPGAIFVVTRNALGRARELHDAAVAVANATGRRFGLQINPVYRQGRAAEADEVNISPRELGEFFVELWRAWEAAGQPYRLTPIQDFSDRFFPVEGRTPRLSCSFRGGCAGTHVGIDFDLNVAACGRRLDSKAFLGSLRDRPLDELLEQSEELRLVTARNEHLRTGPCADCRFFEMCHGGCVDDAVLSSGQVLDRFHWCEGYRMLFEAMEKERELRPASAKPRRVAAMRTTVHVLGDPRELPGYVEESDSVWLLPSGEGAALRFGSGLDKVLATRATQKLVFVHNRHAKALPLWERSLRGNGVAVVLFEREGLESAIELASGLRARVLLDVPSLLAASDGAELVAKLTERFLFEQAFGAEVLPLSTVLLRALGRMNRAPATRFGLRPGTFDVRVTPAAERLAAEAQPTWLSDAREEQDQPPSEWLAARPSCPECPERSVCAGQLADAPGAPCRAEVRALVGKLREAGAALRVELERRKTR